MDNNRNTDYCVGNFSLLLNFYLKTYIMEAIHNIKYEGLELEVSGEWEEPDTTTGYKGGWSYWGIMTEGKEIAWMLRDDVIEKINEIVVEENY